MNLLPNDIIIRNYKGQETLWVSQRLVVNRCGLNEEYFWLVRYNFKKSTKGYRYGNFLPDTGRAWRWGREGGMFYYDFDRIPDRAPTHYRSRMGTKTEILKAFEALEARTINAQRDLIKENILTQVKAMTDNTDIHYYMYDNPITGFTQKQASQMALAHAWCKWMSSQLADDAFKRLGIVTKQDFFAVCTELIAHQELEGLKISSPDYLRRKIDQYPAAGTKDEQRRFFISGYYGNNNAQVVGLYPIVDEDTGEIFKYDIHQALMYRYYMNPGSNTKEFMRQLYDRYYLPGIAEFNMQPISYRTFTGHCTRFDKQINMAMARHGVDWYKKNILTYVPAEKLKYAHSLFAGDASGTINYRYIKSNGKPGTMKLYVAFIADVASGKIVGWAHAPKGQHLEDYGMIRDALRMAVNTCGRKTMFEFVSDNHGAFTGGKSKDLLNLVFNKVRTIEVGNSQANPAETQFRLFKQHLKDIKNMLSTSWDAGLEGNTNPDHINQDDLPSFEDAIIQIHTLIERWNSTKRRDGTTPNERFLNKHPECVDMDPRILRRLYGNHTKVDISYMRGYVKVSKAKGYSERTEYQFEIPDYGGIGTELIAKYTGYVKGAEVRVIWDETMADLYSLEGKFILSCERVKKASISHAEVTPEQKEALERLLARKKEQMEIARQTEKEIEELYQGLQYSQAVALGATKETYNQSRLREEEQSLKEKTKRRLDRDFNEDAWSDLN